MHAKVPHCEGIEERLVVANENAKATERDPALVQAIGPQTNKCMQVLCDQVSNHVIK